MPTSKYHRRILNRFLIASLLPAGAVALMLTLLADTALARQAASTIDAGALAFGRSVSTLIRSHFRDLGALAGNPDLVEALRQSAKPDGARSFEAAAASTRAQRAVSALYPRGEGAAVAYAVSASGSVAFGPPESHSERTALASASWGIFGTLRYADGAVEPRVAPMGDGSQSALSLGWAVRDDDGTPIGALVVDLPRQSVAEAALSNGIIGGASLRSASGKILFDQSDPSHEGAYSYELPAAAGVWTEVPAYLDAHGVPTLIARVAAPPQYDRGFRSASRRLAVLGLAAAAALASVLALEASRSVTKPVLGLAEAIKAVERGDWSARAPAGADDELGELCRSFDAMVLELKRASDDAAEGHRLLREAELRSLAARTNPHFLHNTLASIKSLAKLERSAEVSSLVTRLGRILRAASASSEGMRSVADSAEIMADYLEIERIRHGSRYEFSIDIEDEALDAMLPSLTLEPLVENALTHGLERKAGGGRLAVTAKRRGDEVFITVEDDGPGQDAAAMSALNAALAGGDAPAAEGGMGLLGTNRRLRLAFGSRAQLRVESLSPGFAVRLRAPYIGRA